MKKKSLIGGLFHTGVETHAEMKLEMEDPIVLIMPGCSDFVIPEYVYSHLLPEEVYKMAKQNWDQMIDPELSYEWMNGMAAIHLFVATTPWWEEISEAIYHQYSVTNLVFYQETLQSSIETGDVFLTLSYKVGGQMLYLFVWMDTPHGGGEGAFVKDIYNSTLEEDIKIRENNVRNNVPKRTR
jgi:hypothetical protein